MQKKTKLIVVVLTFSVALLILGGGILALSLTRANPNQNQTDDTQTGVIREDVGTIGDVSGMDSDISSGADTKPGKEKDADSGDDSEKDVKPAIEEEEALIIDDPPFMTLLRTKKYYYDWRRANILTGVGRTSGYIARDFARESVLTHTVMDGDWSKMRFVDDYSTNKATRYSSTNYYSEGAGQRSPIGVWSSKAKDYSMWKAIDTGTDELVGETLQYIDYSRPDGIITRFYLKDGDVYAMYNVLYPGGETDQIAEYVSNSTGNPPNSIFN